jgi:hypothetical protein
MFDIYRKFNPCKQKNDRQRQKRQMIRRFISLQVIDYKGHVTGATI